MNQKLTLSMDSHVIMQAKNYAKRNNTSVSRIAQDFFASLPKNQHQSTWKEMSGIIKSDKNINYHDHLDAKYGS